MSWLPRLIKSRQPNTYTPLLPKPSVDPKGLEDGHGSDAAEPNTRVSTPSSDVATCSDNISFQGLPTTPPYQSLLKPLPAYYSYADSMPPTHITPYTANELIIRTKVNLEIIATYNLRYLPQLRQRPGMSVIIATPTQFLVEQKLTRCIGQSLKDAFLHTL